MVRRTVPILVRITGSSVDGRPIGTTCGTGQQVIRTGVDGALVEITRYHRMTIEGWTAFLLRV